MVEKKAIIQASISMWKGSKKPNSCLRNKLLEHESKLETNLEENKRMYNEMQRLLNGVGRCKRIK